MHKALWLIVLGWLVAACAPVQVGLETRTVTRMLRVTATVAPEMEGTVTATATARRPTAAVHTVTATATMPTQTPSAVPASPTPPPATATRIPPTVPPTATPSATLPPTGPVEISSFTADREVADLGETVTLAWSTLNAAGVRLHTGIANADGLYTWSTLATDLPAAGTYGVGFASIVPAQLFRLEAFDANGDALASSDLGVGRRNCPEAYVFTFPPDRFQCAAGPARSAPMAEQIFEHGRLVWLEANSWINPRSQPIIFVLTNAGTWVSRSDDFVAGEPESDPALMPPDGLYQPVGSLGKLWRNELRDSFGWALAPEVRYTGAVQSGWNPMPGGVRGYSYFAQDLYLKLSDNGVLRLVWSSRFTGQTWERLP